MAKQLDPRVLEVLKKYHHDPRSAVWDCHGTLVVYHKDVELIAAKAGIEFHAPMVLEANGPSKCVALSVSATFEGRTDWSIGEAAPGNNKNAYPYAMAEKRARDRVALKLLGLAGFVYSEEEADEFKEQPASAPRQSAPAKEPIDPAESEQAREFIIKTMDILETTAEFDEWGKANAAQIGKLLPKDQDLVRQAFKTRRHATHKYEMENAA